MAQARKQPGTPNYHIASARKGQPAKANIPLRLSTPAEFERENQMRALKLGMLMGFGIAALVFGIILWGWVIPTMDAAVATAQGMVA